MRAAVRRWWHEEPQHLGLHFMCAVGLTLALFFVFLFSHYMARYIETRTHEDTTIREVCVANWDCTTGTHKYGKAGDWAR